MQQRLLQLVDEFNQGSQQLHALDQQRARLRDQLLRVAGAIDVLRELNDDSDSLKTASAPDVETASDAA